MFICKFLFINKNMFIIVYSLYINEIQNFKSCNMKNSQRASIAYIAGKLISSKKRTSVYDYSQSKHIMFSGSITSSKVAIYEHDRGCHIKGSGNNGKLNLYHYGDSHHITLDIKGNTFKGYDFGSSCHFSGKVNNSSIAIYDYGVSSHFNYVL